MKYFIVYQLQTTHGWAPGSCFVVLDMPISENRHLRNLEQHIKSELGFTPRDIVITDFREA